MMAKRKKLSKKKSVQKKGKFIAGMTATAIAPPFAAAANEWKRLQKIPYEVRITTDQSRGATCEYVVGISDRGRGLYDIKSLQVR